WHNGTPTPVKGFCTDVFFEYAKRFIKSQVDADKPFLAYIASNAPHGPMHCPEKYSAPYKDQSPHVANFFGMIANIDDNVGALRAFLEEQGIADNTIFIFTTDNGSSSGWRVFNADMRDGKGSEYDGGHRVPFFVQWPNGKLGGGWDVTQLTAHVDVLPTLIDLCEIDAPLGVKFDGTSLKPLLYAEDKEWPDRILVTDSQRVKDPIKWRKSSVMTADWRLINGKELYQIKLDPGQKSDVASGHPEVVERLRDFYEAWWSDLEPSFSQDAAISLGHPSDNPARLTSHDWITTQMTPWNQGQVRSAMNGDQNTGFWNVNIVEAGEYTFRLRRWPLETGAAIKDALPAGDPVPGERAYRTVPGKAIQPVKAILRIANQELTQDIEGNPVEVVITTTLPKGKTRLTTLFETKDGEQYGAYFVYVTKN
ncbi:MAG: sulfatase-like hydrolase/transferase, partial [Planctomycetaceae bacterium]|nr:sulfatase-like hydrolase/transferase [Planctomycetaceae bacterium]